jgi:hypothetical protein
MLVFNPIKTIASLGSNWITINCIVSQDNKTSNEVYLGETWFSSYAQVIYNLSVMANELDIEALSVGLELSKQEYTA